MPTTAPQGPADVVQERPAMTAAVSTETTLSPSLAQGIDEPVFCNACNLV